MFNFFVQIREFVRLGVACSMKQKGPRRLVVDCFEGGIDKFRGAGPPERPHREARRPLAQRRRSTLPSIAQGRRKPSFSSLFASERQPGNLVTKSARDSIAVSSSLLPPRVFGAASADPRDPSSDSVLDGAGKTSLPLAA